MSSTFSAFFAAGKRITFELNYCGKPLVRFDSDDFTFNSRYEIGRALTELIPIMEKAFKTIIDGNEITFKESITFQHLFSGYEMCEYPTTEIYELLVLFTIGLNHA